MEKKIHTDQLDVNLDQNSFATKIEVFISGKIKSFSLAVLQKNYFFGVNNDEVLYFIGYVEIDDNVYVTSFYSGGATGCGVDEHSIYPLYSGNDNVQIITTDLYQVIEMIRAANKKAQKEEEKFHQNQILKAEKINKLPKTFVVPGFDQLEIRRSDAEYKRGWSRNIQGGSVRIYYKEHDIEFHLDWFIKKGGALLVKKFEEAHKDLIGDSDSRQVLQSLIDAVDMAKRIIKNA